MHTRHGRHAAPKKGHKKRRWLGAGIVVPVLMGGAAFGYFEANLATGHVDVATPPSFTVNVSDPTGTPLSPGSGTETVSFHIINQLNHAQTINGETFAISTDSAGGTFDTLTNTWNDNCLATWFDASTSNSGGVTFPTVVQPNQALINGVIIVTMPANITVDQSACVGTEPQVSVALT